MKNYTGLTNEQVKEALTIHGDNKLTNIATESFWDKLKGNLEDPIIRILILALIINVVLAVFGLSDWIETVGIAIAVTLATGIGTWSEHSNEESFQKLQAEAAKIMCKVYREGVLTNVCIDDIVKGDIVVLQTGDLIPADGKLLEGSLAVDQASLNGESRESKKLACTAYEQLDFQDTFNQYTLFRGTVVTEGEAVMEVVSVGDASLYGQLVAELTVEELDSPLKAKLTKLADIISKVGYAFGILIFIAVMFQRIVIDNDFNTVQMMAYLTDYATVGADVLQAFILGVIVIVVAVPEGLPLMISLVLSLNMRKMLASNVHVRKLVGIETSGNINILFSDKTGTISKGQLEVVTLATGDNQEFTTYTSLPEQLKKQVRLAILNNTGARRTKQEGTTSIIGGNATDKALVGYVDEQECHLTNLKIVDTLPFTSSRKFSATKVEGDITGTLLKGAPEVLLHKCNLTYNKEGEVQALTPEALTVLDQKIQELATRAIRVIILATTSSEVLEDTIPQDCTLVAIVGIRDDVRPEAVEAIKEVQDAGIQVVMVTGDHKETGVAIAKESGLLTRDTDIVLTSAELNEKTDEEVKELLPNIRVIARALPTDKSRLVRLAQEQELVVGMTGDGANDAPALKRADVGFAMGISGTEVAKEASDIVLMDDNFQSIAQAVLYGRTIYRSIQKFIVFQLTLNVAACLIVFLAPLLGMESPLTITQMLWVNIVMDSLGALAFGSEPALRQYMQEKPKQRTESIVTKEMLIAVLVPGLALTGIGLWFLQSEWVLSLFTSIDARYTAFFAFFILFAVVNGFNVRTKELNVFKSITKNQMFLKVMALIVVVQIAMIYIGGDILRTVPISLKELGYVLLLSLVAYPIGLLRKLVTRSS